MAGRSEAAKHQPVCLILSRQNLPTFDREHYAPASGVARGAYVMADAGGGRLPEVILIGTGSEVAICVDVYEKLKAEGVGARVVSMPSWELFEQQDDAYRASVLPPSVTRRVAVEQPSVLGWDRYAGTQRRDHRHENLWRVGAIEGFAQQIRLYPGTRLRGCQRAARAQGVMRCPIR